MKTYQRTYFSKMDPNENILVTAMRLTTAIKPEERHKDKVVLTWTKEGSALDYEVLGAYLNWNDLDHEIDNIVYDQIAQQSALNGATKEQIYQTLNDFGFKTETEE